MLRARQVAEPTVLVDDDRVKVTRWDFAPGAETGWHRHGMDYVVTTITPCTFVLEERGGGSRTVEMEAGSSYRRDEGVEHNVVNGGNAPMAFVEMELK
ncbi:MAG: cupin domain-containing protein [Rhizobiaceae bacterium]